jgi:hypothetical protein
MKDKTQENLIAKQIFEYERSRPLADDEEVFEESVNLKQGNKNIKILLY